MVSCRTKKINLLTMAILFALALLLLSSCRSTNLPDTNNDIPTEKEPFFHFGYGGGHYGSDFTIWQENGETYFECYESPWGVKNVYAEVDAGVFDDLEKLVHENQINKWNGFDKRDNASDGDGFIFAFKYGDISINAQGVQYYPKNYEEGHEALKNYLYNYYENIPMPQLNEDSVGRIILNNKEYVFIIYFNNHGSERHKYKDTIKSIDVQKRVPDESGNTQYAFSSDEVIFNTKAAEKLREKVFEYSLIKGDPANNESEFVSIVYGGPLYWNHSCHTMISPEESKLLMEKITEVVGLPAGFDWELLFIENSTSDIPVKKHYDEETRTLIVIENNEIGTIQLVIPEAYDYYEDFTRHWKEEGMIKAIDISTDNGAGGLNILVWDPLNDSVSEAYKNLVDDSAGYEKKLMSGKEWHYKFNEVTGMESYYIKVNNHLLLVCAVNKEEIFKTATREMLESFEFY